MARSQNPHRGDLEEVSTPCPRRVCRFPAVSVVSTVYILGGPTKLTPNISSTYFYGTNRCNFLKTPNCWAPNFINFVQIKLLVLLICLLVHLIYSLFLTTHKAYCHLFSSCRIGNSRTGFFSSERVCVYVRSTVDAAFLFGFLVDHF